MQLQVQWLNIRDLTNLSLILYTAINFEICNKLKQVFSFLNLSAAEIKLYIIFDFVKI